MEILFKAKSFIGCMLNKPAVTVIMSVYNTERYLSEAIESVLNQTFQNFEFIIINDCSTDGSKELILNYVKSDKRILFIDNIRNIGSAGVRNAGLKIAKGKYIAIMDSDDIALPERLEKQYSFLETNKDIYLVGTGAYNIDSSDQIRTIFKPLSDPNKIEKRMPIRCCIYHSTIFFRNDSTLLYRDKAMYCEDYDLYLRLMTDGKKMTNLLEPLVKYRISENSVSKLNAGRQILFIDKIKEFYLQRLNSGKDNYDNFDVNSLLSLDLNTTKVRRILGDQIEINFKLNNHSKARYFCLLYFKTNGVFNKYIIYFFTSFLGKDLINKLRKYFFN